MPEINPDWGVKILLVEDDETDVKITLKALDKEQFKYQAQVVRDGQEALDYLKNSGPFKDKEKFPKPDIILSDINMPKMDGHTFVRELKSDENLKSIPIVVFTTKDGMEDLFKVEGINDYVIKSADAKELIELINKNLNRGGDK